MAKKEEQDVAEQFMRLETRAKQAAANGDPSMLRQLDKTVGITRNPDEYESDFYASKQEHALSGKVRRMNRRDAQKYFANRDENDDGVLNEDEMSPRAWAQYDAETQEGGLTQAEVTQMRRQKLRQGMARYDKDGQRQQTSFGENLNKYFAAKDKNRDGYLSEDEMSRRQWMQYGGMFREDGQISMSEASRFANRKARIGQTKGRQGKANGALGDAMDNLFQNEQNNRLTSAAKAEKMLGVKLPNWVTDEGVVSERELATFINRQFDNGNMAMDSAGNLILRDGNSLNMLPGAAEGTLEGMQTIPESLYDPAEGVSVVSQGPPEIVPDPGFNMNNRRPGGGGVINIDPENLDPEFNQSGKRPGNQPGKGAVGAPDNGPEFVPSPGFNKGKKRPGAGGGVINIDPENIDPKWDQSGNRPSFKPNPGFNKGKKRPGGGFEPHPGFVQGERPEFVPNPSFNKGNKRPGGNFKPGPVGGNNRRPINTLPGNWPAQTRPAFVSNKNKSKSQSEIAKKAAFKGRSSSSDGSAAPHITPARQVRASSNASLM